MSPSQPDIAASTFPVGKTPCSTPDGDPVILMCPPAFFTVSYAINPWMEEAPPCDTALAKQQWDTLYDIVLNTAGAHVELLEPVAELPDLVFTANAAFVYEDTAVIARYKHPERQPEEELCADWFAHQGFQVFRMPNELPFEGAGDALIWNNCILAGYGTRTALESHTLLSQATGLPVISLELTNPRFYHIDVCLCPLADGSLVYAPSTFTVEGLARLEAEVPPDKRIPVSAAEAARFACNAVNINDKIILNQGSPDLVATLKTRGFQVIPVNLSEFLKAGGSAKCLSLRVG